MSNKQIVLDRLRAPDVPFEHHEHAAAHTIPDCYVLPYYSPDITICKNILLCNRQKTAYYLYLTLPDKPFRTADVSKLLGVSRLSFAPQEALPELLQLESGSLSALALWFDADHAITLVVDREVCRTPRIAFHPCDNTATVIFTQDDFWQRVVPTLGVTPILLDVPWPEPQP